MKIGLDVMGGDFAPEAVIEGAVDSLAHLSADDELVLVVLSHGQVVATVDVVDHLRKPVHHMHIFLGQEFYHPDPGRTFKLVLTLVIATCNRILCHHKPHFKNPPPALAGRGGWDQCTLIVWCTVFPATSFLGRTSFSSPFT